MANKLENLSLMADVKNWVERFEFHALANSWMGAVPDLADDNSNAAERTLIIKKNVAMFISKCDAEILKLLKALWAPENVADSNYLSLRKLLLDHLAPAPTKFAKRHKFRSGRQQSDESGASFISRLRSLANECEFGTNYNEALLDQILCGLKDEKLVSELLVKTDLDLETAIREALNREQAQKEAQGMHGSMSATVNSVEYSKHPTFKRTVSNPYLKKGESSQTDKKQYQPEYRDSNNKSKTKCNKCGLRGHEADKCEVRCYKCSGLGHIRSKCRKNWGKREVNNVDSDTELQEFDDNCNSILDEEFYELQCNFIEVNERSRLHDNCSIIINSLGICTISRLHENIADSKFKFNSADSNSNSNKMIYDANQMEGKPTVDVLINGKILNMEFDSGSAVSVVSKRVLVSCGLSSLTLKPSRKTLRVASGQQVIVDGYAVVDVTMNGKKVPDLHLYVAENFPTLLGRPWITKFCGENWLDKLLSTTLVISLAIETTQRSDDSQQLKNCEKCAGSDGRGGPMMQTDGTNVKNDLKLNDDCTRVDQCRSLEELKLSEVFKSGLGLVKDVEASLVLRDDSNPIMLKARSLPYALRHKVEDELNSMVESGILSKVDDSPWGTPLVPVKKDGGESVRICGDYKSTLNKCVSTRQYPLPTAEECFNTVRGGLKFSKVDIKKAYNNIQIRDEDRVLTTLNTHKGLYQWNRLPYGISSSAAIFQSIMDDTLRGVPMTCCRIDDILISGKNDEEHLINLNRVISRLERRGFKCKLEKTCFMEKEVIYLGHRVSAEGIQPVQSKVDSLKLAPEPKNVDQLVSFLGAVNYYRRYLPNLSSVIAPLYRLKAKGVPWKWSNEEHKAFQSLKNLLCSRRVLTFYNPKLPLKLDTDASKSGIGAVLSHIMPNGEERPIEYVSRTLSSAERNYAQIDKEALAIVWSIKRLHIYLYGRRFKLVTDHKALVRIFGDKPIPEMTANRITRWALFLTNYQYDIEYRTTKDHANCDMLSRLPKEVRHPTVVKDDCLDMFSLTVSEAMLNAELVARETKKDPILSKVFCYILEGWPDNLKCEGELASFWSRRDELTVELGCVTCKVERYCDTYITFDPHWYVRYEELSSFLCILASS